MTIYYKNLCSKVDLSFFLFVGIAQHHTDMKLITHDWRSKKEGATGGGRNKGIQSPEKQNIDKRGISVLRPTIAA